MNFAFDKARKYFAEQFQQDLSAKATTIPREQLVEPKASIAGPALQGLAFTHEEPNLKEMYLSLLATAMDGRVTNDVHPAFVEIIKQLNSEEALLLQNLLRRDGSSTIVEIRVKNINEDSWEILEKHLMNFINSETKLPMENKKLAAMVDNWVRLGLVEVDYGKQLADDNSYKWVDQRPEYLRHKTQHENETQNVSFKAGVIARTAFGIQFGRAVGLL